MDGIAIRVDETRIFKWAFKYSTNPTIPSNEREDEILRVEQFVDESLIMYGKSSELNSLG